MSLQDIIDWWSSYQKEKKAVPSCGAWPFSVPPRFDIFLDCCIPHDVEYHESEVLYALGVIQNDEEMKLHGLEHKAAADEAFILCIRERYNRTNLFFRPLAKKWGEKYISLVLANSNRVWFSSIGVIIAEHESGDNIIIKLALRNATKHGPSEEKEVFTQAQSLAGAAKARYRAGMCS